ncbi:STM0539 family protein [Serratia sp. (in: enterobacteria)]|uniref:STM0539 family protein n=1 Tax=Serratia sp. (in: enterobacteria) TaxID=616 RepID=UPI00398A0376
MKKLLRSTLLVSTLLPFLSHAELSNGQSMVLSAGVVSLGSSMLVSGLILSPILLPANLIMRSVEKNKKAKTATLTTKTPDGKEVKLQVPEKVADEAKIQPGDKLTLEKAPEGTGALLKKDGKVISHMLYQGDAGLSQNQMLPTTK